MLALAALVAKLPAATTSEPKTTVTIEGEKFLINGQPTYAGRSWKGRKIEGLLLNARMVQGVFDDLNPETVHLWAYPDTGKWDAERNTREFLAAMPAWRAHGLLAFTISFQGGSPAGYVKKQPWINSAFRPDGSLRPEYLERMGRIITSADNLGMVVILSYFYVGQDRGFTDDDAILRATDGATRWVLDHGWRNVIIELDNECDINGHPNILMSGQVHELIGRVKQTTHNGRRLLVSTSYRGKTIPDENVVRASDFLLLHGNGVEEPEAIAEMVRLTRQVPGYTPKPILFNEDDHFDFDAPTNHFTAALDEYASWGYFDYRVKDEDFNEGYQSIPANWAISSSRKVGFFRLLAEITDQTSTSAK
jgi:hypothetical protein